MTATPKRDLEKELAEYDQPYPPTWRYEQPGDTLLGKIIRYGEGQGKFGPVRTVTVERDDGRRAGLWLSSSVLLSEFQRQNPRIGERIGVRYLGRHPEKQYHRFALVVDRPQTEADFAPLGGETDDHQGAATFSSAAAVRTSLKRQERPLPITGGRPAVDDPDDPFSE